MGHRYDNAHYILMYRCFMRNEMRCLLAFVSDRLGIIFKGFLLSWKFLLTSCLFKRWEAKLRSRQGGVFRNATFAWKKLLIDAVTCFFFSCFRYRVATCAFGVAFYLQRLRNWIAERERKDRKQRCYTRKSILFDHVANLRTCSYEDLNSF